MGIDLRHTEYLAVLTRDCLDAAKLFRFDQSHPWHFTVVALYGSIVELAGCIVVLSEHDGYTGLGSVLRTQLEAYVDFVNLVQDRSYGRHMDAADAKQLRTIYRRAVESDNPYLLGVREHEAFGDMVKQLDEELQLLKVEGIESLGIEQRFSMAGMTDLYDGVYRVLCTDTHSNRSALLTRHLEQQADGNIKIAFYRSRSEEDLLPFLDSAAGILVDSTERVHEALELKLPQQLVKRMRQLDEMRAAVVQTDTAGA